MAESLKEKLINGAGYALLEKFIPDYLLASFRSRIFDLYPVRASSSTKDYAERDDIKNLKDISIFWSQAVDDFKETQSIRRLLDPLITQNFPRLIHYISDTVTINPGSEWINPHVDTPHRFKKYNYDPRLLGIQCIITLYDTNKENGSTGLVPYSQKRNYDIDQCYQGKFDRWFLDNAIQPNMPAGSLLLYNCRVLHSSMPNRTINPRPALLVNYLDESICDEIRSVDNVWSSNGKSP